VTLRGTDAMREDTLLEDAAMFANDDEPVTMGGLRTTGGWSTSVRRSRRN
jgi:hypothetical protein